jgi:hypothetical protein
MNRRTLILPTVFSLLLCVGHARQNILLHPHSAALELALTNVSAEQRQALARLRISHTLDGVVDGQVLHGKRSRRLLVPMGEFLTDLAKWASREPRAFGSSVSQVMVCDLRFSYFIASDVGLDVPQIRIEITTREQDGRNKVYVGSVVSGHGFTTGLFEAFADSPKTQQYFSETVYRALMLTLLEASNLATPENTKRSLRPQSRAASRLRSMAGRPSRTSATVTRM